MLDSSYESYHNTSPPFLNVLEIVQVAEYYSIVNLIIYCP